MTDYYDIVSDPNLFNCDNKCRRFQLIQCTRCSFSGSCNCWKVSILFNLPNPELILWRLKPENYPLRTGFKVKTTDSRPCCTLITCSPVATRCGHYLHNHENVWTCQTLYKDIQCRLLINNFIRQYYISNGFEFYILKLCGFDTISCYADLIVQLLGDMDLRDLLVDSGVYDDCTVDHMLSGKIAKLF